MISLIKLLLLSVCVSCTTLFYHPDRILYYKPENLKLNHQEVTFNSLDGTELIGWFFPAKTPKVKGTFIHFHGNAQNISTHFLVLSWVMEQGYNLFIFDYRGYGISDGKPSIDGIYLDSLAALDKGRSLWAEHGQGKLIVYGQSLGGAVAMRALEDYQERSKVDLLVQDSTFMSYRAVAFNKLLHSPLLPFSPLAYLIVSDKYASKNFVPRLERPTLVIVGLKDHVIDPKFGKEIYKRLQTKKKWLWKIPDGRHIDVFHHQHQAYRQKLMKLLDEL